MINFESGVLDRTRLVANVLMVVLLGGNIFFSIQYASNIQQEQAKAAAPDDVASRIQTARFLKLYIDTVLTPGSNISVDDRIKLENDIRQLKDADLVRQWDVFVASEGNTEAQVNAVKLMSLLVNKLI